VSETFSIRWGTVRQTYRADRFTRRTLRKFYRAHRTRARRHPDLYGIGAKRNARNEAAHLLLVLEFGRASS
jgi:hypothetical protein